MERGAAQLRRSPVDQEGERPGRVGEARRGEEVTQRAAPVETGNVELGGHRDVVSLEPPRRLRLRFIRRYPPSSFPASLPFRDLRIHLAHFIHIPRAILEREVRALEYTLVVP